MKSFNAALLVLAMVFPSTCGIAAQEHGDEAGRQELQEEQGNEIHLSESQRQRLAIRTSPAESGTATSVIQAPATVRFNADRVARVGPLLESRVVEVTRDLGDFVESGETVAVLDSVELGRIKARYLSSAARVENAEAEYRRDRELAEQQLTSEAGLLESRTAFLQARAEYDALRAELRLYGLSKDDIDAISADGERPLSRYLLASPVSGTVQQRELVPGRNVSPEESPVHIVNTETMWVFADVFEQDVSQLAPGQPVGLSIRSLPDRSFSGTTDWISKELDETARTVRVRAAVPNGDGLLRAGMFGTARIITDSAEQLPLVPVDSVQTLAGEQVVFIPGNEDGAYLAVPVETGREGGGLVEITGGVQPGDPVVTSGAFDLMSALTAAGRSAEHNH